MVVFTAKPFEGVWIIQTEGKLPRNRKAREIIKKYTESSIKRNQLKPYNTEEQAKEAIKQMLEELATT